jgi:NitT/TauT family transport system substrate-binding protein
VTEGDEAVIAAQSLALGLLAAAVGLLPTGTVRAEVSEVALAYQFGIGYLPFMIMRHDKLVEKHLEKMGLMKTQVAWAVLSGAVPMNDSILAGKLHFATGGAPPALNFWEKTRSNIEAKIFASVASMPSYLITRNPNVKTIKDFTDKDRISMAGGGQSAQTRYLQMELAKYYGLENYNKLNHIIVNLPHVDGFAALISGTEITAQFTSPPFQNRLLARPGMSKILDSYDVMGGPHTFTAAWSTEKFRSQNPKTFAAVLDALKEAMSSLNADKKRAAALYVAKEAGGKDTFEEIYKLVADPEVSYSITPRGLIKFTDFMHAIGVMKMNPKSWKDLVFPELHSEPGS